MDMLNLFFVATAILSVTLGVYSVYLARKQDKRRAALIEVVSNGDLKVIKLLPIIAAGIALTASIGGLMLYEQMPHPLVIKDMPLIAGGSGGNVSVEFINKTYERSGYSDRYNYKVTVKSPEKATIDLRYIDYDNHWIRANEPKFYQGGGEKILVWKNQPWHRLVDFVVIPQNNVLNKFDT
jgi:hypothetical protein